MLGNDMYKRSNNYECSWFGLPILNFFMTSIKILINCVITSLIKTNNFAHRCFAKENKWIKKERW